MTPQTPDKAAAWLRTSPSLEELRATYPEEWHEVEVHLARLLSRGGPAELSGYLKQLSRQEESASRRTGTPAVREMVRYRMAREALQQHYVATAAGVDNGTIRFNLLNGLIAQKLLFARELERKPVSLFWFRLCWPLIWQKRYLMPLVQPKGVYCFYTGRLISRLAQMIGQLSCLEIAAGDGSLSRFLKQHGVDVTASDDYSWQHAVTYPDWVVKREAREALRQYAPEVVICSWPPAGNNFERQIFRTRSVRMYILITSRHRHAAGDWECYREQNLFAMEEVPGLSCLVLPPELDPAVYLFTRNTVTGSTT